MKTFRGPAMQKGYGLGGLFKGLARSFAPTLKKGLISAGKKALTTGVAVLNDVAEGKNVKESMKRRTKQSFLDILPIKNSKNAKQVSRKRAITKKGLNSNKKRKLDIFDG